MATGTTLRSTVQSDIPTVLTEAWILYRMPALVFSNIVNFEYAEGISVGDTIQLPQHTTRIPVTQIAAGTRIAESLVLVNPLGTGTETQSFNPAIGGSGGAEVSPYSVSFQQPTVSQQFIIINQFWQGAVQIGQYAQSLAAGDIESIFRQSIFDNLAVQIDTGKANQVQSSATSTGTYGNNLQDEDFLTGLDTLNANNVPAGDRHFVLSTQELTNVYRIERFINRDYIGEQSPITDAEVGLVYNMHLHATTNTRSPAAGQHDNGAIHKDSIASQLRVDATPITLLNPNTLSQEITIYAIWGDMMVRTDHSVLMKAK